MLNYNEIQIYKHTITSLLISRINLKGLFFYYSNIILIYCQILNYVFTVINIFFNIINELLKISHYLYEMYIIFL